MKNKLILDESCEIVEAEKLKEEMPSEEDVMAVNSMISNLIQSKWQAIDLLNGNIAAMQQYGRDDVNAVLSEMISDNYIHIGQLEKLLEMNNSGAANIEAGKEDVEGAVEAADNLGEVEVDVEPVEEVEEALQEKKGFLKNYKSGRIHDAGDCYVATDKHGTTLGSEKTVAGAEALIDELPEDDVDESLVNNIHFEKQEGVK